MLQSYKYYYTFCPTFTLLKVWNGSLSLETNGVLVADLVPNERPDTVARRHLTVGVAAASSAH